MNVITQSRSYVDTAYETSVLIMVDAVVNHIKSLEHLTHIQCNLEQNMIL